MKRNILIAACILGCFIAGTTYYVTNKDTNTSNKQTQNNQPVAQTQTQKPTEIQKKSFDRNTYSTTEPSSIWFVANKHFALPINYAPTDLTVLDVPLRLAATEEQMKIRKIAANDLTMLFTDAKTAELQLEFGSGYRSAAYQKTLYDGYVTSMGKTDADRSSARPGHSEHQTGLALDFTRVDGKCHLEACFASTEEGTWLVNNAYKYGFILRYTSDKEQVTGYMFEPWHYRYVGKDLALEMHDTGIKTLEEFFGLGAAPDYKD